MSYSRMPPLARTLVDAKAVSLGGSTGENRPPTPQEKAAIIVRLLLSQGEALPLETLPEELQAELAQQMGQLRLVDRETVDAVMTEFMQEIEDVGLSFPDSIDGTLEIMDGHISANVASRLRRMAGSNARIDPWPRVTQLGVDRLAPLLNSESTEVAAVLLSKLPIPIAAELLGRVAGERARKIAYAVSQTSAIDPQAVRRIGWALAQQLDAQPAKAFAAGPVERVGAILNLSSQSLRDDVLDGLEADDADFAEMVRQAIFTFHNIPQRISPRDMPKILRLMAHEQVITALAAAKANPRTEAVCDYILNNISPRLAQSLRDELEERGSVSAKDGEAAMAEMVVVIRQLETAGDLIFQRHDS